MRIRHLLLASMALSALPMMARDVHGVNGFYNYTAQQINATGNMFSWFVEGSKYEGFKHSDMLLDGDYLKLILGKNSDEKTMDAGKFATTTQACQWRASFDFLHDKKGDSGLRLKVTKENPVVAIKFALPINVLDSCKTDVGTEMWWINPVTGACETIGWQYGMEGINNGRCDFVKKYPGTKVKTSKDENDAGRDSVSMAGRFTQKLDNGVVMRFQTNDKKWEGEKNLVVLRLPDNEDKAEFIVLVNYAAARDYYNPTYYYLANHDYIEIPSWHLNFGGWAKDYDEDGLDLPEEQRPTMYLKWVKTFKNIEDAVNNEITKENNWGDGTESIAKSRLNYALYYAEQYLNGFLFRNAEYPELDDMAYKAYKEAFDAANKVFNNASSSDADYEVAVSDLEKAKVIFLHAVDLNKELVYNYLRSANGTSSLIVGAADVTVGDLTGKALTAGSNEAAVAFSFVPTGGQIDGQRSFNLKTSGGTIVQASDGTLLLVSETNNPAIFTMANRDGENYDLKCGDYYYYLDNNGVFTATKAYATVDPDDYDAMSNYMFTVEDALNDYVLKAPDSEKTGLFEGWEFNDAPVDDPSTKGVYNGQTLTMAEYGETKMVDNWRMSRWRSFSRVNQETVKNSDNTDAKCLVLTSAPTYASWDGSSTGLVNDFSGPAAMRYDAGTQEPFYACDPSPRDESIAFNINAGINRYFAIKMKGTADVGFGTLTFLGKNDQVVINAKQISGVKGDVVYWDMLNSGFSVGKNLFTSAFFSPTGFTSADSKLYVDWMRTYDAVSDIPEEKFADGVATGIEEVVANKDAQFLVSGNTVCFMNGGSIYGVDGTLKAQVTGRRNVNLPAGVYIVKTASNSRKVVVK